MTPPRAILRAGWAVHRALFAATGGRVGTMRPSDRRVGTLFLLSRGRLSGVVRRNGLFYVEDDTSFVVVASNAGAEVDPNWWLNLLVTPDADVELGARRIPVRARAATAAEAARLWPRLDAGNPEFVAYRAKTTRPIPLLILERRQPVGLAAAGRVACADDRTSPAHAHDDPRAPRRRDHRDRRDDGPGDPRRPPRRPRHVHPR